MRYAEVSVNSPIAQRKTFSYAIPSGLSIDIGHAVWVPFGDKLLQGIVTELVPYPKVEETKEIVGTIESDPLVFPTHVSLARWLSEYYLSPLFAAVALMLPPGFERRTVTFLSKPTEFNERAVASLTPEQKEILEVAWTRDKIALTELEKAFGVKRTKSVVSRLIKTGLLVKKYELEPVRAKPKTVLYLRLIPDLPEALANLDVRTSKQTNLIRHLSEVPNPISLSEVREKIKCDSATTKALVNKGLIEIKHVEVEEKISAKPKKMVYLRLVAQVNETKDLAAKLGRRAPKQANLLNYLSGFSHPIMVTEARDKTNCTTSTIRFLVSKSLIELQQVEIERFKIKVKKVPYLRLLVDLQEALAKLDKRVEKQTSLLKFLAKAGQPVPLSEVRKSTGCSPRTVKALVNKGLVELQQVEVEREPISYEHIVPSSPLPLTFAQDLALRAIKERLLKQTGDVFLLHGVTASGKTEVYLQALAEAVKLGKRGIVLVPEIALTPQTIERFASRFPHKVAVLHSGLTPGEHFDEWRRIKRGEFDVVIGPRSALFAPSPNLGLIVIDEEHEWTYKQQDTPRYHARDSAIKLAELTGAVVILGSATPDVESFYHAQRGEYHLLELPERVTPEEGSPLPQVEVVDLREELKAGNRSLFSRTLSDAIAKAVGADEQVILFLNRRGSASFVQCRNCGFVVCCRRCEVPLAYHFAEDVLLCHQCNRRMRVPQVCPRCSSRRIKYLGAGTEKLEQEAGLAFSQARLLRWDSDVTRGRRFSHQQILDRFRAGEANILVVTQMIAKGLDLPRVTLVGVVNADTALHLPDFRSGERTFQLLSQVAGRAGRGILGGKVVIQTFSPEHYAIQAAAKHDYHAFYEQEVAYRRELHNPPFSRLARLVFSYGNDITCQKEAESMKRQLIQERDAKGISDLEFVGPAPAFIHRLRGRFRWQIIIRGANPSDFLSKIAFRQGWTIDIDPVGLT